jgi:hypothetical protein
MSSCSWSGGPKKRFATYQDALKEFVRREQKGYLRADRASIYSCPTCESFHISKTRYTLLRRKGRGKTRRKLVARTG